MLDVERKDTRRFALAFIDRWVVSGIGVLVSEVDDCWDWIIETRMISL